MKKIILALLMISLLANCKDNAQNNQKTATDSHPASVVEQPKTFPLLEGKIFSFGMNLEPCDGLTYSEYTDEIAFHDKETLTRTVSSAMEIGSPDFYMAIEQIEGTYQWLNDSTLQVNYTTLQFFEERTEGEKILKETKTPAKKSETFLFSTQCPDGKAQLIPLPKQEGSFSLKN